MLQCCNQYLSRRGVGRSPNAAHAQVTYTVRVATRDAHAACVVPSQARIIRYNNNNTTQNSVLQREKKTKLYIYKFHIHKNKKNN